MFPQDFSCGFFCAENMWIKFIKDTDVSKKGGVVWCPEAYGQGAVNSGKAIRCLNPDGDIFEDATPEDIITQLAKEDGTTFEKEEKHLEKVIKKLTKKTDKEKVSLGNYIPDSILDKSDLK